LRRLSLSCNALLKSLGESQVQVNFARNLLFHVSFILLFAALLKQIWFINICHVLFIKTIGVVCWKSSLCNVISMRRINIKRNAAYHHLRSSSTASNRFVANRRTCETSANNLQWAFVHNTWRENVFFVETRLCDEDVGEDIKIS